MRHGDYASPKFYIEITSNSIYTYLLFWFLETSTSLPGLWFCRWRFQIWSCNWRDGNMLSDGIEFQCTWEFPTLSLRETKSSGSELRFLATSVGTKMSCLFVGKRGARGVGLVFQKPWVFHGHDFMRRWANLREGSWSFFCAEKLVVTSNRCWLDFFRFAFLAQLWWPFLDSQLCAGTTFLWQWWGVCFGCVSLCIMAWKIQPASETSGKLGVFSSFWTQCLLAE